MARLPPRAGCRCTARAENESQPDFNVEASYVAKRHLALAPCSERPPGILPLYLFYHVSKTGGSSFRSDLDAVAAVEAKHLGATSFHDGAGGRQACRRERRRRDEIEIAMGIEIAYSASFLSNVIAPNQPAVRVLLLAREPIEHVVSMHEMCTQKRSAHRGHGKMNESLATWVHRWADVRSDLAGKGLGCLHPAEEMLRSTCRMHPLNYQTVNLGSSCDVPRAPGQTKAMGKGASARAKCLCGVEHAGTTSRRAAVRLAHARIEHAYAVGTTAYMSALLVVLIERMGLPPLVAAEARRRAVHTARGSSQARTWGTHTDSVHVPVSLMRDIRGLTELDDFVYAAALQRLDADLNSVREAMAARGEDLDALLSELSSQQPAAPTPGPALAIANAKPVAVRPAGSHQNLRDGGDSATAAVARGAARYAAARQ